MSECSVLRPPNGDEPSALAGCVIQGYRLRKPIGEGPRAFVYEGEQIALRRQVALKILKRDFVANADRVGDFLDAARASAGLNHPGIASLYDVLSLGDIHFVVREYLNGEPLAMRADKQPLTLAAFLRLARELLAAIGGAHAAGIIHGNLSPANVFLGAGGEAKVTDFCYSPFAQPGFPQAESDLRRAIYVDPERLLGKEADIAGDIYSLGATLYFAATGLPPYAATEIPRLVRAGEARIIPRPEAANPALPKAIGDWLVSLLAPHPLRPGSSEEAAKRLEDVAGSISAKATSVAAATAIGIDAAPPLEASSDRRRYRRLPAEIMVKVAERATAKDSAVLLLSRAANVGENGIFVRCSSPLAVGTFVDIEMTLAEQKAVVKAVGVVRWTRGSGPDESGMGIQFLQVATDDRRQLQDFLEERAAAEVIRRLTQSPAHRVILKQVVCHWEQKLSMEQLCRAAGASRPILLRALSDFEKEKVVCVRGEEILCVRPASPRLAVLLEKTVLGSKR